MSNTLMILIVVGGACWCLKQWLGHIERRDMRFHGGSWHLPEMKKGGMNKWLAASLCFLYIVWPIDIVPDFLPVVGWGDDVLAAVIGLRQLCK